MKFELSKEDLAKVRAWQHETVFPQVIADQKQAASLINNPVAADCWKEGYPYAGAIGGDITYSFSPTSLGVVIKVKSFGFVLDLTDYDSW